MKKVGDLWRKFKGLEEKVIKILIDSKSKKTTNEIRFELEKIGIDISWVTLGKRLKEMLNKKQIKCDEFGAKRKVLIWYK